MASHQEQQLHFVLFPLMAPGHMNPMVDFARLLAQQGIIVTIFTTPNNAARFGTVVTRAIQSGQQIRLVQLNFPSEEAGLPEGCENFDMLPSQDLVVNFFRATALLHQPAERQFEELTPKPNCIISDVTLSWTTSIASKFGIPRIHFSGTSCFCLVCVTNVAVSNVLENVTSELEYLVVPDIPDRIEMTKAQVVGSVTTRMKDFNEKMALAEKETYGTIMNTFEELEPAYAEAYKKKTTYKVWCIGPTSLCNKDDLDKAQRGNKASSVDEHHCLKWLDSREPGSVVYACLGSQCNLVSEQLVELALGLEASNKPFIWVVRGYNQTEELEMWISENGFEERTKERSLLIRGWAPQPLILSHPAIGGFLTHCGWNSILEGICAGVPLITWPLFADQFMNEKLVEQVLKVAVRVGVEHPLIWGEAEKLVVLVKKEKVKEAIEKLMDGEESRGTGERARELGEMAKRAVEEGGSSYLNIRLLIEDIRQQASNCRETN